MQVQFSGWEDPLEKQMAGHSVFLPGKFHRERRLVGYSPWDCKRVRHDLETKQQQSPTLASWLLSFPFIKSNFLIFQKLQLSVSYVRSCGKEQSSLGGSVNFPHPNTNFGIYLLLASVWPSQLSPGLPIYTRQSIPLHRNCATAKHFPLVSTFGHILVLTEGKR